ncbi:hypothetical protein [Geminocystis herdmanii]|uniref:hypothetical protein n=1 Tax=Geminocystis herdmanii TaxID=669359 RepID=UPI00034932D7|nr:hypothetical protein [Geminocystis herdmanii]
MKNQNYSDDINNILKKVYQKIQALDKKCQELEKANQRIIVTGSKSQPQPKPINISEEELINVYNYTPQILAEYVITVSVTADTYRQKTAGKIYLESTNNGYYWVILREEGNEKFYHLVPNGNRQINLHRFQNKLKSLFVIQGKIESNNNNLIIEKLANLEILPSGYLWQLLDKGIIKIDKPSSINKLLNELQKINTQSGAVPNNITNLLSLVHEDHQNLVILIEQQKNSEKYIFDTINKFLQFKDKLEVTTNKLEIDFNNQKQEIKQLENKEGQNNQQINLIDKKMNELKESMQILLKNVSTLSSITQEDHNNLGTLTDKHKNLEKFTIETVNKFLELKDRLDTKIAELEIKLNYQKEEIRQLKNK